MVTDHPLAFIHKDKGLTLLLGPVLMNTMYKIVKTLSRSPEVSQVCKEPSRPVELLGQRFWDLEGAFIVPTKRVRLGREQSRRTKHATVERLASKSTSPTCAAVPYPRRPSVSGQAGRHSR